MINRKPISQEGHDSNGWEKPDPTPVALPIYVRQGASTLDQLRQQAYAAQRAQQDLSHMESFEEADDFEVGDDYEALPMMDAIDNRNDHQEAVRSRVRETLQANELRKKQQSAPADKDDSRGTRESHGNQPEEPEDKPAPSRGKKSKVPRDQED